MKIKKPSVQDRGGQCCGWIEEADLEFCPQAIIPEHNITVEEGVEGAAMQRP